MDTFRLTIDGHEVEVKKGTSVLEAAIQHGHHVPYYCYHPGLGIDGSCRVCIVKIEKMPKLQTACSMICTDGMVVHTDTPDVVAARASVFEFLLINHPLDCPVCDKGGECPLQDFSYAFGPSRSRMEFPRRVFDGEGVRADVDFGPTLLLNRNRCILCTRCVRFMREVGGDAQISIIDRGSGSEIATFQEQGVHSLLSGNLADVCPVGAITTRSYRFKSRPWDNPHAVDTICTYCAKGCNTTAWTRGKQEWAKAARLIRITPRLNPEVNDYWMCDLGRFDFQWIEGDDRLKRPLVRHGEGSAAGLQPTGWSEALGALADRLKHGSGVAALKFLVSAHASLEELWLLKEIVAAAGTTQDAVGLTWRDREKPQPTRAKFRVPAVEAPNVRGARDLGFAVGRDGQHPNVATVREAVEAGRAAALYVYDPGPEGSIGDLSWVVEARRSGRLPLLVFHGVLMTDVARAADIVLPGASSLEKDATYANDQGRVQGTSRVLLPPGEAAEDWQILVNLAVALGTPLRFRSAADIRQALEKALGDTPPYAGLASLAFARPVPARTWLQASNPSERWKWDFMFQDLPPVKFAEPSVPAVRLDVIPLRQVD